jgi:hypothetical protein
MLYGSTNGLFITFTLWPLTLSKHNASWNLYLQNTLHSTIYPSNISRILNIFYQPLEVSHVKQIFELSLINLLVPVLFACKLC